MLISFCFTVISGSSSEEDIAIGREITRNVLESFEYPEWRWSHLPDPGFDSTKYTAKSIPIPTMYTGSTIIDWIWKKVDLKEADEWADDDSPVFPMRATIDTSLVEFKKFERTDPQRKYYEENKSNTDSTDKERPFSDFS